MRPILMPLLMLISSAAMAGNAESMLQMKSEWFDGDKLMSSPRLSVIEGQRFSLQIGEEGKEVRSLSCLPTLQGEQLSNACHAKVKRWEAGGKTIEREADITFTSELGKQKTVILGGLSPQEWKIVAEFSK